MPDVRRLAPGGTPEQVLAGEVGRLRREVDSLKAKLLARIKSGGSGDAAWTAAAYENSWTSYSPPTYPAAGYRKDASGVVHLRGMIKSGGIGQAAFTLPAGYRPDSQLYFPVNSVSAFGAVYVTTAGAVVPYSGSSTWVSLAGITFYAGG